jgi:hypothetical protein
MSTEKLEACITMFTHAVAEVLLLCQGQEATIRGLRETLAKERLLDVTESEEVAYVEGLLSRNMEKTAALEDHISGLMSFLEVVESGASKALESHYESLVLPGYKETANVRLLASQLRAIGAGSKTILDAYRGGSVILSPEASSHVN